MPLPNRDMSNWDWIRKQIADDAPVPYNANDPDDGPYDPNDDAAVDAFFDKATIWVGWPNQVMIQNEGVPVNRDEAGAVESDKPRTRAS